MQEHRASLHGCRGVCVRAGVTHHYPVIVGGAYQTIHGAAYLARASLAVARPSLAALHTFGPGYTIFDPTATPPFMPEASTWPQSCAAFRRKGIVLAKPWMVAASARVRSVALAPTPLQSSQALRYPAGCFASPSPAAVPKSPAAFTTDGSSMTGCLIWSPATTGASRSATARKLRASAPVIANKEMVKDSDWGLSS